MTHVHYTPLNHLSEEPAEGRISSTACSMQHNPRPMDNPYCSCKLTLVMAYSCIPYGEPLLQL